MKGVLAVKSSTGSSLPSARYWRTVLSMMAKACCSLLSAGAGGSSAMHQLQALQGTEES